MRVGSLFAGIGGFDTAFEAAGASVAWQVEIDPTANRVLARHWPNTARALDVRDVGADNLAPVDVITFGSPCQDLSVAGKRGGLDGARSGLYFEAIRIVRELRPTFALWENVPGALSSRHGLDFAAALDSLADAGALDIAWTVLDAQWFGVAQRRRRLFVVADFRAERAAEILAIPYGGPWDSPPRREAGARVAANLTAGVSASRGVNAPGRRREDDENLVAGPVSGGAYGTGRRSEDDPNLVLAHTLRAEGHDTSEDGTGRGIPLVTFGHRYSASQTMRVNSETTDALRLENEPAIAGAFGLRRLTPIECLRLQGLPDDWLDDCGLSDSAKYRLVGNSVAVPVVKWIARRLVAVAEGSG